MSRTSPFFVPQKEINLIDSMNEELIDEIIGQAVDIYQVEVDETDTSLYGESSTKYFSAAFRVNCLINFEDPETTLDELGSNYDANIEMYFHRTTLEEAGFYPEIGDIVDWNEHYFEINSVTEPQLVAGHQHFKHSIITKAHKIRNSALQIGQRVR